MNTVYTEITFPKMVLKIEGDRKVVLPIANKDMPRGLGLHQSPVSETVKEYDHYYIESGICLSSSEAIKKFWKDYEEQGPYKDGVLFWRHKPELNTIFGFGSAKEKYHIYARFSIG